MKKIAVGTTLVAVILLSVGIRTVTGADDIHTQIEAANRVFEGAFARADAVGVAACYSEDGQILPPGAESMTGREAIATYWGTAMKGGAAAVTLKTLEVEQHGDTAIEIGAADILGSNGNRLDAAKYVVIWKRVDGAWKLHRDIWNSSVAPPQ